MLALVELDQCEKLCGQTYVNLNQAYIDLALTCFDWP